jgi:hypothetical protein
MYVALVKLKIRYEQLPAAPKYVALGIAIAKIGCQEINIQPQSKNSIRKCDLSYKLNF